MDLIICCPLEEVSSAHASVPSIVGIESLLGILNISFFTYLVTKLLWA